MLYLLMEDWTVLYRPGDKPDHGRCPACSEEMSRLDINPAAPPSVNWPTNANLASAKDSDGAISTIAGDRLWPRSST